MVDRVGQQLGNYHLVRRIGEGGFADVYLGEHIHLGTRAAIKVLQMQLLEKKNIDAFHNEARMIAHLVHPHIIRVLDYGVQDWVPFLVMDYAPGGTLRQRFTGKPAQISRLFPYITQMAAALQYAHDRHLIHRDVKPENMLLGTNGEILLTDFGFAMVVESINSRGTKDMSGTAVYMAPEQLKGQPCAASDQYSLGVVIYEWLSGTRPFHGSFSEVASQQMLVPIQPLREKVPDLAPEIEAVVMRALAQEPEQRFGSIKEFAQSLLLAYQASRRNRNAAQRAGASMPGWLPPATSGVFPPQSFAGNPNSLSGLTNPNSLSGFSGQSSLSGLTGPNSLSGLTNPNSQTFKRPSGLRPPGNRPTSPSLPSLSGLTAPPGGQPTIPSQSMKRPVTQTSLPGIPRVNPQTPRSTGPALPPLRSSGPFPPVSPSSGYIPSIPRQKSTQGNLPAVSSEGNRTRSSSTRPFPSSQQPSNQFSLSGHIATPSPAPVPSTKQSSGNGSFYAPVKPVTEEEEIKQLYAELDEINKANTGTKPLPHRGRSGFDKTVLWLISILVIVLVLGSSGGVFYLANANQAKNSALQATATSESQNAAQMTAAVTQPTPAQTTDQTIPTATVNTANPYPPKTGTLVINDPLSKNNYKWQEYTDTNTGNSCKFANGAYHVASIGNSVAAGTCFAQATDFTNFTYQVQMNILQAGTQFSGGGIMFRGNSQSNIYYYFEIYKSGRYNFTACFGKGKANCTVQISGYPKQNFTVAGFNTTPGQPNTLAVVAHDTAFDIYVNQQHALGPIYDGNFTHGMIGVYATGGLDTGPKEAAEVVFSNVKVWRQ
jgi:serine/threonine protein kinase